MQEVFGLATIGPNRRSDATVIEQRLAFGPAELDDFDAGAVRDALDAALPGLAWPGDSPDAGDAPAERFMALHIGLALALQRAAGHPVTQCGLVPTPTPNTAQAWFEHEDVETGQYAAELSMLLLAANVPALVWQPHWLDPEKPPAELFQAFVGFARPRMLPGDARAISAAAARLDIPCINLDRDPYSGLEGDFRVRPNGMLMLGHGRHRQLVDGTISINRSGQALAARHNPAALAEALRDVLPGGAFSAEPEDTKVLVAGGRAMPAKGEMSAVAEASARRLQVGLLGVAFDPVGRIVRLDPAPVLADWLDEAGVNEAAERFVGWLFPEGAPCRVPIAAVTGTNGKTTTSRMIDRMLQVAGRTTSLKCSDGLYLAGELQHFDGPNRPDVYFLPFERPEIEAVVQEMHFGRIVRQGFAYLWSDVAVCTNVTTDHIGRLGADDHEAMAQIKRAVVERAKHAAVLNEDDERVRVMGPHLQARQVWRTSLERGIDEIRQAHGPETRGAVLEAVDGRESIVLYIPDRLPLMPLDDIPATFDGTARFNVSNAMQAACAGFALGVPLESVREALAGFRTDMDMGLGRMNVYDCHPFTVILDFAHNADGIRRVGQFLERQDIQGRKIMLLAAAGEREEIDIREKGKAAAEYFDHFVVRPYPDPRGREPQEIVDYMSRFIIEGGADESAITRVFDPDEAITETLRIARPGDWLVMNWGNGEAEHMWGMITAFEPAFEKA